MKLKNAQIRNFRRLENIAVSFDDGETLFVGPNNSGKTSATSVFRCFLDKRSFQIHDFPLSMLKDIDDWYPGKIDDEENPVHLPEISLDLWLSLDPVAVPYGKISALITSLESDIVEVGIGCTFKIDDPEALWAEYTDAYPEDGNGARKASLSDYLKVQQRLKRHFSVFYSSLKQTDNGVERVGLSPSEGKKTLRSLLRVDFVDAQRNIQDDELTARGGQLSEAFASFYEANLEQAEAKDDAIEIIENHNRALTEHYKTNFKDLMDVLKKLGVPSAHERELEVVSNLEAADALKGTTDLVYTETGQAHSLPEAYNGLGFKNLVLMAVQLRDFQVQWAATTEDRPLCHIIFIEEPEVHLHAQVQQTFISNMWTILNELAEVEQITPQLVVTTHSSHILNSVAFEKVRYFRRRARDADEQNAGALRPITDVHSLKDFKATAIDDAPNPLSEDEALDFLKRYMTLTHCDLMFADAAVLIEGSAERLLLPAMIDRSRPELKRTYLTVLEVGGAYAHVFSELLQFLHLPYLVITDLDSVKTNPETNRKMVCSADQDDAVTSNAALKAYFPNTTAVAEFNAISEDEKIQADNSRYIGFQQLILTELNDDLIELAARTFEEALIFENLQRCGEPGFLSEVTLPNQTDEINQAVHRRVQASSFKKTDFALTALMDPNWATPTYISKGLDWLAGRLDVLDAEELNGDLGGENDA